MPRLVRSVEAVRGVLGTTGSGTHVLGDTVGRAIAQVILQQLALCTDFLQHVHPRVGILLFFLQHVLFLGTRSIYCCVLQHLNKCNIMKLQVPIQLPASGTMSSNQNTEHDDWEPQTNSTEVGAVL